MKKLALLAAVAALLVTAPTAAASVRRISLSSRVAHGHVATLVVAVSPAATCSITVNYKSGPSHAQGLTPMRGGTIAWSWIVGTRTTPGRWPITVACGAAGTLTTSFVVV